jgi:hypothetical protein
MKKSKYKEMMKTRNLATIKSHTNTNEKRSQFSGQKEETHFENHNYNNRTETNFDERREKFLNVMDEITTVSTLDNDKIKDTVIGKFIRRTERSLTNSTNKPTSRTGRQSSINNSEKFSTIKSKIFTVNKRKKTTFFGNQEFIKLKNFDIHKSLANNPSMIPKLYRIRENEKENSSLTKLLPTESKRRKTIRDNETLMKKEESDYSEVKKSSFIGSL